MGWERILDWIKLDCIVDEGLLVYVNEYILYHAMLSDRQVQRWNIGFNTDEEYELNLPKGAHKEKISWSKLLP